MVPLDFAAFAVAAAAPFLAGAAAPPFFGFRPARGGGVSTRGTPNRAARALRFSSSSSTAVDPSAAGVGLVVAAAGVLADAAGFDVAAVVDVA